jgi:hypothetical protein
VQRLGGDGLAPVGGLELLDDFAALEIRDDHEQRRVGRQAAAFVAPHPEAARFEAVNILREEPSDLSVRFAKLPEGRFSGIAWRPSPATGSPVLEDVLGVLECRTLQVIDAGDHRVLIGEVVEVGIGEGRPLVFFRSEYMRLG